MPTQREEQADIPIIRDAQRRYRRRPRRGDRGPEVRAPRPACSANSRFLYTRQPDSHLPIIGCILARSCQEFTLEKTALAYVIRLRHPRCDGVFCDPHEPLSREKSNSSSPASGSREGDLANLGHSNNIIIEMKDYLIVVDANFPSGARLAMETAKRISPKPVKYVFDTHHHGDHAYGNPIWTKAGATTLAYVGVAEEMKRFEPARWQAAAKDRPDVAELHLERPRTAPADFRQEPLHSQGRFPRSAFLFLRLGAHARRRLRLPAQGAGALHRRCRGQRPLQLYRRRQCRQLAESSSLGANARRALHSSRPR